jgi:hypothetical protein
MMGNLAEAEDGAGGILAWSSPMSARSTMPADGSSW